MCAYYLGCTTIYILVSVSVPLKYENIAIHFVESHSATFSSAHAWGKLDMQMCV